MLVRKSGTVSSLATNYARFKRWAASLNTSGDLFILPPPPIDVWIIWHAYVLNPPYLIFTEPIAFIDCFGGGAQKTVTGRRF